METEACRTCGGDGRIGNALGGSSARCPSCQGSGKRADSSSGFRDVTKTKPSHYRSVPVAVPAGPKAPVTAMGIALAGEVNGSALAADAKTRLVAEIMNHENTHGVCTKTFVKKLRKQVKGGH
jgi:hypothetical protein